MKKSKCAAKKRRSKTADAHKQAGASNETPPVMPGSNVKFTDVRELVDSIFEKNDPVTTATDLLRGKANPTVAKIWGLLLEYRYGKPSVHIDASGPEGAHFNFITLAPRPQRDLEDLTEETLTAGAVEV